MPAKPSVVSLEYVPDTPDFLGDDTRVLAVSDMLEQAQRQRLQYSQMMLINDHTEDDELPQGQAQPGQEAPKPVKYGERIGQLDEGIRRLLADNQDIAKELADEAHARRLKAKKARAEQA